jgi:hypothetical protein
VLRVTPVTTKKWVGVIVQLCLVSQYGWIMMATNMSITHDMKGRSGINRVRP